MDHIITRHLQERHPNHHIQGTDTGTYHRITINQKGNYLSATLIIYIAGTEITIDTMTSNYTQTITTLDLNDPNSTQKLDKITDKWTSTHRPPLR